MKYKVVYEFPYGKTWLKSFFIDDRISSSIEIPEFTQNESEAKLFKSKHEAENAGKFYCGCYKWSLQESD